MAKKSQVIVTVIGHNYNQNGNQEQFELQPGQKPREPGQRRQTVHKDERQRQNQGEHKQEQVPEASIPKYKKHDSIPIPSVSLMANRSTSSSALSGVTNLSGVSHLDVLGCSSSEYDDDEDDGIMVNTDDEDSSSFKNIGHRSDDSRQASMDSNTGSLDSLFTNGLKTGLFIFKPPVY